MGSEIAGGLIQGGFALAEGAANRKHQKEMQERQQKYNKESMGLQWGYNEKSADAADRRTRALMEDYETYQAKVKQMKEAGLNIGMMYGGSGASGQSVPHGAQGAGVGLPGVGGASGNPFTGNLDVVGLGLMKAQKEKIEAETKEIQGNTPKAQAEIDKLNNEARKIAEEIENEKIKQVIGNLEANYAEMRNAITENTIEDQVEQLRWSARKTYEEWRSVDINNTINDAGKETLIRQFDANYNLTLAQMAESQTRSKLNTEEALKVIETTRLILSQIATEKIKQSDYGKQWQFKGKELQIAEERIKAELEKAGIMKSAMLWGSAISAGGNAIGSILKMIGVKGVAIPSYGETTTTVWMPNF